MVKLFQQRCSTFDLETSGGKYWVRVRDSINPSCSSRIYLTIQVTRFGGQPHQLKLPNREVRPSLAAHIWLEVSLNNRLKHANSTQHLLYHALANGNLAGTGSSHQLCCQHTLAEFLTATWIWRTAKAGTLSVLYAFFSSLNARIIPKISPIMARQT